LGRNVLLTALAAVAAWFALDGESTPDAVRHLGASGWASVMATVAAVAVAVLVVGGPSDTEADLPGAETLDYERRSNPYGVVTVADDSHVTLGELAVSRARLIVLLNPNCGPCVRTAEKLDAWADRLAPSVGVLAVYPDARAAARGCLAACPRPEVLGARAQRQACVPGECACGGAARSGWPPCWWPGGRRGRGAGARDALIIRPIHA